MTLIFTTTFIVISLYLVYPIFLLFLPKAGAGKKTDDEKTEVTMVYLSCNGKSYLRNKVKDLLEKMSAFDKWELIIIDDSSTDGSKSILNEISRLRNVRVYVKETQKGIPHSMNMAANYASYKYIIFCDQRQEINGNILPELVDNLQNENIAAVSSCISSFDKINKYSVFRSQENIIKKLESKSGNLIGVYGPLYVVRKENYKPIPEHIILDDLYLSLRIMADKQVRFKKSALIYDENFSTLYDYSRTKRYLKGFIQILSDKELIKGLSKLQLIMLLWHKYLRLFIPGLLFLSYVAAAIMSIHSITALVIFVIMSLIGIISCIPCRFGFQYRLKGLFQINVFYNVALMEILWDSLYFKKAEAVNK